MTPAQAVIHRMSAGKRVMPAEKDVGGLTTPDGLCGICNGPVPENRGNQFYCCWEHQEAALNYNIEAGRFSPKCAWAFPGD